MATLDGFPNVMQKLVNSVIHNYLQRHGYNFIFAFIFTHVFLFFYVKYTYVPFHQPFFLMSYRLRKRLRRNGLHPVMLTFWQGLWIWYFYFLRQIYSMVYELLEILFIYVSITCLNRVIFSWYLLEQFS